MPLAFTKKEVLSSTTFIHQVENGTIFYRNGTSIWVRHNDKKIEVELDGGFDYSIVSAQRDSLYYGSNWKRKIYKAEFTPSGTIEMQFIREMVEGESIHSGGMMSFVENAEVYTYRINYIILKHVSIDPRELKLTGVARNCTMLSCYRGLGRRFMEFSNDVQTHTEYNSPWGSPTIVKREYIYLTNGKSLLVVNPADRAEAAIRFCVGPTCEALLSSLIFSDVSSFYIAGVHEGILTGRGKCEKTGKFYLMTAQLPSDFITNPQIDLVRCEGFIRTDLLAIAHSEPANEAAAIIEEKIKLLGKVPPNFSSKFSNEFSVRNVVGSGGFGIVFEANHLVDNGSYAVKRISVESSETVEKALDEARAMAKLEHVGIVRYYTSWIEEPPEGWQALVDAEILEKFPSARIPANHYSQKSIFLYIQLQLCKYSLEEWLTRNEPRTLIRMKLWFKQIVTAVAYIHEQGLIHRDLKPSNILFADDDMLKICDLGIVTSRTIDDGEEIARTYTNAGTPLYMAPEQSQYRYTSKVDVFTLGLIFVELCVEMTNSERKEIFGAIKCEEPTTILQDQPTAREFVDWLTLANDELRPTCQDLLRHAFLQ